MYKIACKQNNDNSLSVRVYYIDPTICVMNADQNLHLNPVAAAFSGALLAVNLLLSRTAQRNNQHKKISLKFLLLFFRLRTLRITCT